MKEGVQGMVTAQMNTVTVNTRSKPADIKPLKGLMFHIVNKPCIKYLSFSSTLFLTCLLFFTHSSFNMKYL